MKEILTHIDYYGIYHECIEIPEVLRRMVLAYDIPYNEIEPGLVESYWKEFLFSNDPIVWNTKMLLMKHFAEKGYLILRNLVASSSNAVIQRIKPGEGLDWHIDDEPSEKLKYLIMVYFTETDNYLGRDFVYRTKSEGIIKSTNPFNGQVIIIDNELEHKVEPLLSNHNITTVTIRIKE